MRQSRHDLEQELRRRINEGVYAPGSRLPLRRELLDEFGASPLTLQRAMDRLAEQGFVLPQGTRGTFVAERLPNRTCLALLFPNDAEHLTNRFFRTLHQVGSAWPASEGIAFKSYFLSDQLLDVPEHRRLCADLADGGLAGIISATSPHYLIGSPLFKSKVPHVVIGTANAELMARYRSSYVHMVDGGTQAAVFRWIRSAGRQRVAFLNHASEQVFTRQDLLREHGLTTRPEWWLGIPASSAVSAQAIARLLCSPPPPHRPDALVITDDNLVPYAIAGVLDAGLQASRDLVLAAHTNFPAPTHAALPCLRYGIDVVSILRAAAEEVERLVRGGKFRIREVAQVINEQSTQTV